METLYALIIVSAFGAEELVLETTEHYNSKAGCEQALEDNLNQARKHGALSPEGVRFGGACVLMEKR